MGNLLGSILSTSASLRAFSRGLDVVQNNVSNANTPGFVKQTQDFTNEQLLTRTAACPEGYRSGPLLNARDEFAEQAVRRQQSASGAADQTASGLTQIESLFDLSATSGISGSLSKFFDSFSQLSVAPNSNPSRQGVLDRAKEVAQAINQNAAALTSASGDADHQLTSTVAGVNQLLDKIATYNKEFRARGDAGSDPSLDANVHRTLEELSQLVDFNAVKASDGSTTILLGGQTTAVIGDHSYHLGVGSTDSQASVYDAEGLDNHRANQLGADQRSAENKKHDHSVLSG